MYNDRKIDGFDLDGMLLLEKLVRQEFEAKGTGTAPKFDPAEQEKLNAMIKKSKEQQESLMRLY